MTNKELVVQEINERVGRLIEKHPELIVFNERFQGEGKNDTQLQTNISANTIIHILANHASY